MLQIKNITKFYKNGSQSFKALDNVSVNFGDKGLVIVLGKSGCGKSTLLNIMGGLDKPSMGEVIINGASTLRFSGSDYDAYRNTYVGIVFQEFNLIDEITVYENINMTLKLQEKSADVNTVDEALAMVGLNNLGYRKPTELSGGQRQRVALARALLKKPEIILADEPTGALDSSTSEDVFESLKKIAETKLVIVVTHEKELALKYGDRVVEIIDGQIVSDKERESNAVSQVKELGDSVVEVSSGGNLELNQLNKKLKKSKINFVGVSHDKDRIALAYPDTVDSFYLKPQMTVFKDTDTAKLEEKSDKVFKLSKGRMRISETIKMAKGNIKRTKKKYNFLTVLTMICFSFVCVSFIVGSLNMSQLVSDTAYFKGAQPIIETAKIKKNNYGENQIKLLNDADLKEFEDVIGNKKFGKLSNNQISPAYANKVVDIRGYDFEYGFDYFNGVIEGALPSDLGIKIIYGSEILMDKNDIIISDCAAFELCRSGFLGYDDAGAYGIHYLENQKDLIDAKLYMDKSPLSYRIVGIYKTNFIDYQSTASASQMDSKAQKQIATFNDNRQFMYSKLFALEGFSSEFSKVSVSSSSSSSYSLEIETDEMNPIGNRNGLSEIIYDKNNFYDRDNVESKNKYRMLYSTYETIPEKLGEKEIIVSINDFKSALGVWSLSDDEFLKSDEFKKALLKSYNLTVRDDNLRSVVSSVEGLKIVGIIDSYYFIVSDDVSKPIFDSLSAYASVVFNKGNEVALKNTLTKLRKAGFVSGSAKASAVAVMSVEEMLETVGKVFNWIALGFAIFVFLIIFNYMSASIRFRRKEIAVYRVVGAKGWDVSKIFLAEGMFITIKTTIGAIILAWIITSILNSVLSGIVSYLGLSFSLLTFNFLFHPLFILVTAALFVLVCSILPILRMVTKAPIDAMRKA